MKPCWFVPQLAGVQTIRGYQNTEGKGEIARNVFPLIVSIFFSPLLPHFNCRQSKVCRLAMVKCVSKTRTQVPYSPILIDKVRKESISSAN